MLPLGRVLDLDDATLGVKSNQHDLAMSWWLQARHILTRTGSIHWREMMQWKVLFSWDEPGTLRSTGTSWLDGLRGIAAMQVVFFHFFGRYTPWLRTYGSTEEDHYIHQLPIFRSIWGAGSSAVCLFFVISGYAITVKCLTLLRRGNLEELYKSLTSSVIRRGFRLYLPIILLAFPAFVLIRCLDMNRDGYIYDYERKDTVAWQFAHLLNATDDHLNPFMYPEANPSNNRYAYVPTSWTIPMEYHGSIVTYILMLVLSRVPRFQVRAFITGFMALYALHRGSWWVSNFLVGMLTADYVMQQQGHKGTTGFEQSGNGRRGRNAAYYLLFFCGYYLAGMCPSFNMFDFNPKPKPGYEFLYKLQPPYYAFRMNDPPRWWWYWSGNMTFFSISQLPRLRAICESRFCQWLGKLSFPLYLVHAAVIAVFSTPIQDMVKDFTENQLILCVVEFSLIIPVSFMLAGVVERYIDRPSIQFSRYIEQFISKDRPLEQEEGLLRVSAVEMEERLDRASTANLHA